MKASLLRLNLVQEGFNVQLCSIRSWPLQLQDGPDTAAEQVFVDG